MSDIDITHSGSEMTSGAVRARQTIVICAGTLVSFLLLTLRYLFSFIYPPENNVD